MCKKPHANARNHGEARLRTRKKAEDQGDDARHPDLRDPAVLLIDQLKEVYIDGELEVIDTTGYYPKIQRKDFPQSDQSFNPRKDRNPLRLSTVPQIVD